MERDRKVNISDEVVKKRNEAFNILMPELQQYEHKVMAYVISVVGDREASKEIMQDAWLSLWENSETLISPSYSEEGRIGWFFKNARNKGINYLHYRNGSERGGGKLMPLTELEYKVADTNPTPEKITINRDLYDKTI